MTERDIERWIETEISRRRLLRQAGAGVTALSFASFLAACGDDGGIEGGGGDQTAEIKPIPKGEIADQFNFSNWPLYIDKKKPIVARRLREEVRHEGQVHRGDQRQHRVLRQGAPDLRTGRLRRPRHARRHRLDGVEDEAAGLRPEARQVRAAERRREPDRRAQVSELRPGTRVVGPVAERIRGDRLPQGPGRQAARERQRHLRSQAQGQGHDADRDGRHGRPGDARDGHGSVEGRGRPGTRGDREDRRRAEERPDPPLHRERLHPRPHEGRLGDVVRLVGRRDLAQGGEPEPRCRPAGRGVHAVLGQHADPRRRSARVHGPEVHGLRLPA